RAGFSGLVRRELGCAGGLPERSRVAQRRRPCAAVAQLSGGGRARRADRRAAHRGRVLGRATEAVLRGFHRPAAAPRARGSLARGMSYKIRRSVLVLVHTAEREVLLLERALRPGYWQSVTGSVEHDDEALERAAERELAEETGIGRASGRLARCN